MAEPNFNASVNEISLTFEADFNDFQILYRGVERVWIGNGSGGQYNADGVLYAEMVDGVVQTLGPVSGYYYACQQGFTGTFQEWVQIILDGTENARSAARSASAAATSETNAHTSEVNASGSETNALQSATVAQNAKTAAETAQTKAEDAMSKYPRINSNAYWETWSPSAQEWQDTGHKSISEATTEYRYQNSTNGTTIPTGEWAVNPDPQEGRYMWVRARYTWNNGTVSDLYSVSYIGANGTGSVNSVNGMGGNVIADGRNIYVNNDAQTKETIYNAIIRLGTAITNPEIDALFV